MKKWRETEHLTLGNVARRLAYVANGNWISSQIPRTYVRELQQLNRELHTEIHLKLTLIFEVSEYNVKHMLALFVNHMRSRRESP